MKKILNQAIKSSLFIALLFIGLSSFIGYENYDLTPGTIEFIGDAGSPTTFTFRKWQLTKVEIPNDDLEQIKVEVEINTSSLQTSWKDLEKSIRKKKDYFYVKKFPEAFVKIDGATRQEDGSYLTQAYLELKGISKPVELQFTVSEQKPYTVKGKGTIQRREFDFSDDGPKDEVPIRFEVILPE